MNIHNSLTILCRMTPAKDNLPKEVKQQILAAAEQRFRFYGYNKTTMAEIAKDCDMSAANLYRFFENKLDIAVTLACSCLAGEEAMLQETVSSPSVSAAQRLKDFVFATLHHTYKQYSETPRINEMVNAVCDERMDLVEQHMSNKMEILLGLINQGIDSGEFSVLNPPQAAEAILTATTLFDVPMLTPLFSLEKLENKATGVVELILKGLMSR